MIQIKRSELKQLAQNKFREDSLESQNKILVMISTSLSARTSYTVVGEEKEISYENLIALHDRLLTQDPLHSSPFEHCARAMSDEEYNDFIKGQNELYKIDSDNYVISYNHKNSDIFGWCYNLKGFISYRYLIKKYS